MEFLSENWGNLVGLLGFLASVGGLVFAFSACRAAKSAENAAIQARQALTRTISSIDVERAVALINRLMEVHRRGNWDFALALYQDLRRTLSEIASGVPPELRPHGESIRGAIPQVTTISQLVNQHRYQPESGEPIDIPRIDDSLNSIQQYLELLQSDMLSLEQSRGD